MINERLSNIEKNSNKFYKELISIVLTSLEKRPPSHSIQNDVRTLLRDSIFYRIDSIYFHLDMLIKTNNSILMKMQQNSFYVDEKLIKKGQDSMSYIFDDIIFNLCSLLDYFGDLVGCIYIGDDKQRLKWPGCARASRDPNNSLNSFKIASIISNEDKVWVGHLYDYRSKLIHYRKDITSSNQQIKFEKNSITYTFKVDKPELFISIIKLYSNTEEKEEHSIIDIAVWLIDKFYNSLSNIVEIGKTDIEIP